MRVDRRRVGPVAVVYLLLVAATAWPYLQAELLPPRGTAFVGAFYYTDDFYNYLSYVQQAEDGAFLLRNKLVPGSPPTLVNLEWWLVGRVSALLGHRPLLAYRLLGLLATLGLIVAADRWLERGGLPPGHRLPALVLLAFGAGFGGLRLALGGVPPQESYDLLGGMFPFIEVLGNPHFVIATALFAWSLLFLLPHRGRAHALPGVVLGNLLGLARPYDLALIVAVYGLAVVVTERAADWPRRLVPLLGLAPVVLYNFHLFFLQPWFKFADTATFRLHLYLWALGPAAALAALAFVGGHPDQETRRTRLALACWATSAWAISLLVFTPLPFHFAQQFLAGIGFPLLGLAALGLARFRPIVTLAAAVVLGTTAPAALWVVSQPDPAWYPPAEVIDAARALRPVCDPGDLVMAPQEIGMVAAGVSACDAYFSHTAVPGYAARARRTAAVYSTTDPRLRARLLDEVCATHVVLPGETAETPAASLGETTAFRRVAVVGTGARALGLYRRPRLPGCRPSAHSGPSSTGTGRGRTEDSGEAPTHG